MSDGTSRPRLGVEVNLVHLRVPGTQGERRRTVERETGLEPATLSLEG
jgi:hypothetical protein